VSDYFPWRRRALAFSVYSLGLSFGSMIGSSAGYVSDAWGWRSAFYVLGAPGVLVAVIIWLTVREPARGRLDEVPPPLRAGLFETARFIRRQPALMHALMGATVYTLWSWGLMWWTPSYLVRSHHMTLGDAGGALSLMYGVGGTAVLLLTTVVMSRFEKRDARWVPWFVAATILISTVPSIFAYSAASPGGAIRMLWIFIPLSYAAFGPTFALTQNLVPASMRAQTVAILLFGSNIANLVIAPQVIGFASDRLAPVYGAESLRHALIPLAFAGFWSAWHYWRCAKHLVGGLERAGNASIAAAAA
jgi:predicted MFS family arabinose efflux permease